MTECVALVSRVALLTGCTARYTVVPEELERARRSQAPAVPAQSSDGRPVWLAVERIESENSSNRAEVEAWDPGPALRTGGWILLGLGTATALLSKREMDAAMHDSRDDGRGLGAFFGLCFGVAGGLTGAGLLVAGYLTDGPELPPPPKAHAHGPAR